MRADKTTTRKSWAAMLALLSVLGADRVSRNNSIANNHVLNVVRLTIEGRTPVSQPTPSWRW